MTIDEAIENYKKDNQFYNDEFEPYLAEEYKQLVEWLEELKTLREKAKGDKWYQQGRADATEECCKQISEQVKYWDSCAKAVEKGSNEYKIFIALAKNFDEIAKQLKDSK